MDSALIIFNMLNNKESEISMLFFLYSILSMKLYYEAVM